MLLTRRSPEAARETETRACRPAQATLALVPPRDPLLDEQAWFSEDQVRFILAQVPAILSQGQLRNGPWTDKFERTVARNAGVRYAAAFPSASGALEAALTAAGVEAGDEVLLPVQAFVGDAMAVRLAGATPVFCDIVAETHCLQPEEIARRATPRTKAVIVNHMGGLITPDIAEILGRCDAKGLAVIENCAHAHGASWQNRPAGSIGDVSVFSFQSSRALSGGETGAVATNDERLSKVLRALQNSGRDVEASAETVAPRAGDNGFPEISALLGLAQYRCLPRIIAARNEIASYYRLRLANEAPEVSVQVCPARVRHSCLQFIVNLPKGMARERIRQFMHERGVAVSWCYWPPLHRQPLFAGAGGAGANCPVADDVLERNLSLPTDPRMTESQRQRVVDVFLEALDAGRESN